MEAQQATFGTFNLAAEKVAENLDEHSSGVADIQTKWRSLMTAGIK